MESDLIKLENILASPVSILKGIGTVRENFSESWAFYN